jgi:hypothetical protein
MSILVTSSISRQLSLLCAEGGHIACKFSEILWTRFQGWIDLIIRNIHHFLVLQLYLTTAGECRTFGGSYFLLSVL